MSMSILNFRRLAFAEATSFIALLAGSVLKRTADMGILVDVLGPLHGALFFAYVVAALTIREREGWTRRATGWILAGAVLPFGGYVVERRLKRRGSHEAVAPATAGQR